MATCKYRSKVIEIMFSVIKEYEESKESRNLIIKKKIFIEKGIFTKTFSLLPLITAKKSSIVLQFDGQTYRQNKL